MALTSNMTEDPSLRHKGVVLTKKLRAEDDIVNKFELATQFECKLYRDAHPVLLCMLINAECNPVLTFIAADTEFFNFAVLNYGPIIAKPLRFKIIPKLNISLGCR